MKMYGGGVVTLVLYWCHTPASLWSNGRIDDPRTVCADRTRGGGGTGRWEATEGPCCICQDQAYMQPPLLP
jgi:hypothetical protein